MTTSSIGAYTPNFKSWDHLGNFIPTVEFSEGIHPFGEFKPASYLPVQFFDKAGEDWYVILPGKGIAFDNDGRIVPAGLADASATLTYTATDVSLGIIDITTGLAVTEAKTVTLSDIDGSPGFMGRTGTSISISPHVGYAYMPIFRWCGGDGSNPINFNYHNYSLQHQVGFGCDYVLRLPLVPHKTTTESLTFTAPSANISTNTGNALSNLPVAKNTMRTKFVFADAGSGHSSLFALEKSSASDVISSGDYHVDLETGIITVYSGTATPTGVTLTYFDYSAAPTGSSVSVFASALGDLNPGDFVKYNLDSNYVKWTSGVDSVEDICGQVIEIRVEPRADLDKVKTGAANLSSSASGSLPGYAGQMDQMPGSATGGVSDLVHFAGAADKIAVINIINR